MEYLDNVDSEGGPFLLADAAVARDWGGSGEDESNWEGSDYGRACQALLGNPESPGVFVPVGTGQALFWEPQGAGTGDVFMDGQGNLILIRAWLDEPEGATSDDELRTITGLVEMPLGEPTFLGLLEVTSAVLAILWSPESGECIESLDIGASERPSGDTATDSSGLLARVANGHYECLHDEIELAEVSARRCYLIRQSAPVSNPA